MKILSEIRLAVFRTHFSHCGLGFDAHLKRHSREVLNIPYNAFSEIRVDKWKDGRNHERIERILPKVQETAVLMGYSE